MTKKVIAQRILLIISPILLAFVLLAILVANPSVVNNMLYAVLIISGLSAIALVSIVYVMLQGHTNKLQQLTTYIKNLSEGDLSVVDDIDVQLKNDFGEANALLAIVFNAFKIKLNYLHNITQNNLDEDFSPLGSKDLIGNKLVELAQNLKNNKAEIEKAKAEELQRNWISNGLTKFSDILRLDTHDIRLLGSKLMTNLVDYIDANQGALYVLTDEEGNETAEPVYEMVAAVAYNREKLLKVKIGLGEGLVGHCAFEKKKIYLTEIPQDYINISSGLGTANPSTILIVPCILDDKVYGLIELATFHAIEEHQIGFIEKLGESIASTISNVQINEKTSHLLSESKKQSEELAAQEEELRQNLEEMEATQEDLERQMKANALIRQEISYEKFLFDTLLELIPARIFFKDEQCRFIKASRTAAEKFGKVSYHDLVGLSDADLLDPEFAKKTMEDERMIMRTREGRMNFVEHEKLSNGNDIWKTVSKIPLIDPEDKCIGTFGIISDITEFKLLEIQSKKAIENFDNLVSSLKQHFISATFDLNGIIEEANPTFCAIFNKKIENIIGKHFNEVLDSKQKDKNKLQDAWENVLKGERTVLKSEYKVKNRTIILDEIFALIISSTNEEQKVLLIANEME